MAGSTSRGSIRRKGEFPKLWKRWRKPPEHKEPAAPWVINWLTGQIDARNGHLDEAIANFESVLKTKIPDRKFDFSLDYEVNNEMASALYGRARIEPIKSPERISYLERAIAAYRHTLSDRLRRLRRTLRPSAWRPRRPGVDDLGRHGGGAGPDRVGC